MKKDYIKHIVSLLMFGTNGIVASFIPLNSYEIVWLRTFVGGLTLAAIFILTKGTFTFFKKKKHFLYLALSGVAMGASWMCLYEAFTHVGISISYLCYYCGPILVMILSPLLFRERLTVVKVISFLLVMLGIVLVNGSELEQGNAGLGILFGSLSAVTYAMMVIFNKKASSITGLENATLQLFISCLTVSVFVGIKQGLVLQIDAASIVPILILGVLNTGLGCYFYFSTISKLPVQTVAICGYLELVSAMIFSKIFLNDSLAPVQIIGAVLIVGSTIAEQLISMKTKKGCKP